MLRDAVFNIIDRNAAILQINLAYSIVVSQDCDLDSGCKIEAKDVDCKDGSTEFNQFLPNILILPAFSSELLRAGTHIIDLYGIKAEKINGGKMETHYPKS